MDVVAGACRVAIRLWAAAAAFVGALGLSASPAHADWFRAETERFIVYGEGREARIREFAAKLSTFDEVLRRLNPGVRREATGSRLEVYLVRSPADLRRIRPDIGRNTAGFYVGNNELVFAAAVIGAEMMDAEQILFHEYAHHFMLENFPAAYPTWFVEGWAEYFMTTEITPQRVTIGKYSEARLSSLFEDGWLPMEDVLAKPLTAIRPGHRYQFYAQAWLLMHYMSSTPERAAQLNQVTRAIAEGEGPLRAFETATGMSAADLQKALWGYRRLPYGSFDNPLPAPPVTMTRLPASAGRFMLENLRFMTSSVHAPDHALLARVRSDAARFPGDRVAEFTLARAEFTWGDVEVGERIIARWLEAEPQDVDALVLAGVGQILAGERTRDQQLDRFRAARSYFGRAHQLDQQDFRALYHYANSRTVEADYPTENDVNILMLARTLAPSVGEIRLLAGEALMRRGEREEAERMLSAVLNAPHGGHSQRVARHLLEGKLLAEAHAAARRSPQESASVDDQPDGDPEHAK